MPTGPLMQDTTPSTYHILVVDDLDANREMLSRRLERDGYTVSTAEHGGQALDKLRSGKAHYDLILLDIMMPVMNGFEALEAIKSDEKLAHIPVLVISALDEYASVVKCIELGAEDYLTKPIDPVLLRARINASLQKKRFHDQEVAYQAEINEQKELTDSLLAKVIPIGAGFLRYKDADSLAEAILSESRKLSRADGGVLYIAGKGEIVMPTAVQFASLNISQSGELESDLPFGATSFRHSESQSESPSAVKYVAQNVQSLNIPDISQRMEVSLSDLANFDRKTGYRSISALLTPVIREGGKLMGVILLVNCYPTEIDEVRPFTAQAQKLVEALASLAASAVEAHSDI